MLFYAYYELGTKESVGLSSWFLNLSEYKKMIILSAIYVPRNRSGIIELGLNFPGIYIFSTFHNSFYFIKPSTKLIAKIIFFFVIIVVIFL